jgi:hypothetical protein
MKKFVTALVTVATLGAAVIATSGTAEARWGGGWHGGWGYGAGGFVAGALIGGAIAGAYAPYGYYGGGPYGYYGGYYAPPAPYYGPGCTWRRVWNGYAWVRACY